MSPIRGISLTGAPFTHPGDARTVGGDRESPAMRHSMRRLTPMLQWNSKFTSLVLVALLVAIAMLLGNFTWDEINFTW